MSNPTAMALQNSLDLKQMGLCYLGTPYTRYPDSMKTAFEEAARLAGRLLMQGVKVYSPIVHSHPMAEFAEIDPTDHSIWLPANQEMMERCDTLVVAEMRSWSTSFGIAHEIEYFTRADKPVVYLDPERLVLRATPGAVSLRKRMRAARRGFITALVPTEESKLRHAWYRKQKQREENLRRMMEEA